jgi:uncharacterized protein
MATFTSTYRAAASGVAAAALLIGAFAIGADGAATGNTGTGGSQRAALLSSSGPPAKITVTGTGTVTGTPNQLVLSMGVQVNGPSVGSALRSANRATRRVTAALRGRGVAAADIQTSDLSIWPNYQNNSQTPDGYAVSESLTATLRHLGVAGAQIQAAAAAGGNATTVDGISLNLSDTSALLARARAAAVTDAKVKAGQYARALGRPLGPALSVTDASPTQPYAFPNGDLTAARSHSVPISPGSQQLSVSVTVVFALG